MFDESMMLYMLWVYSRLCYALDLKMSVIFVLFINRNLFLSVPFNSDIASILAVCAPYPLDLIEGTVMLSCSHDLCQYKILLTYLTIVNTM